MLQVNLGITIFNYDVQYVGYLFWDLLKITFNCSEIIRFFKDSL